MRQTIPEASRRHASGVSGGVAIINIKVLIID